jgi:hypothetical protein
MRTLGFIALIRATTGSPKLPRLGLSWFEGHKGPRRSPGMPPARLAFCRSASMFAGMLRSLPAGFIAPCLPTKADTLPSGETWLPRLHLPIKQSRPRHIPSSRVLEEVIQQASAEYVTVGWLTSTLHRHSFGIIMLSLGLLAIWKIRSESKSTGGLGEGRRLPRHGDSPAPRARAASMTTRRASH